MRLLQLIPNEIDEQVTLQGGSLPRTADGVAFGPRRSIWRFLTVTLFVLGFAQIALAQPLHLSRPINVGLDGLMAIGTAFVFLRVALVQSERGAWIFIGLGMAGATIGDSLSTNFYSGSPPLPSICDVFWLSFLPFIGIGLAMLVRARFPDSSIDRAIESTQAALIVASFGLMLIFYPVLLHTLDASDSQLGLITTLAYPIGDIVVMSSVVAVLAFTGWRPGRTWLVLGAGLVIFALSDSIYSLQAIQGTYIGTSPTQIGWAAALLLVGYAAWMPRHRQYRVYSDEYRAIILSEIVSVVAVVIQVGGLLAWFSDAYLVPRILLLVAQALVLGQIAMAPRSFRRERGEDSLTGLPNRFALEKELRSKASRDARLMLICDTVGIEQFRRTEGRLGRDRCIQLIARKLQESLPSEATLYRFEESEFVVLSPLIEEVDRLEILMSVQESLAPLVDNSIDFALAVTTLPAGTNSYERAIDLVESLHESDGYPREGLRARNDDR